MREQAEIVVTGYKRDSDGYILCERDYKANSAKTRKTFRPLTLDELLADRQQFCSRCGAGTAYIPGRTSRS